MGTRTKAINRRVVFQDHPHACGDKFGTNRGRFIREGSSPRVWGQGGTVRSGQARSGIIPTRVGTSPHFLTKEVTTWDHPHACGDKFLPTSSDCFLSGSSPRVWGQGFLSSERKTASRIIPTRVGTSEEEIKADIKQWDHPHACGDKTKEIKENSGFAKSTA